MADNIPTIKTYSSSFGSIFNIISQTMISPSYTYIYKKKQIKDYISIKQNSIVKLVLGMYIFGSLSLSLSLSIFLFLPLSKHILNMSIFCWCIKFSSLPYCWTNKINDHSFKCRMTILKLDVLLKTSERAIDPINQYGRKENEVFLFRECWIT